MNCFLPLDPFYKKEYARGEPVYKSYTDVVIPVILIATINTKIREILKLRTGQNLGDGRGFSELAVVLTRNINKLEAI